MKIKVFSDNSIDQNTYLYYDEKSGEGALIDAGCSPADIKAVVSFVSKNNILVKGILLTHGHYDHIIAVHELKKLTSAVVYGHEAEKQIFESPGLNLSAKHGIMNLGVTPDKFFSEGDIFKFGDTEIKVIHTPGHTPGGVCYYDKENGQLFSGDTLFKEAIGRTDFPFGNRGSLIKNITEKLFTLPDDTMVYPGHDESTTIGHEKTIQF